jgi:hypothetical protein
MDANTYQTYEDAAQDYLAKFRSLLAAPEEAPGTAPRTRAAGEIPADVLVDRAAEIASVSSNIVGLSRGLLETGDPASREALSGQLLAQASAEMQLADQLLDLGLGDGQPQTRAVRSVSSLDLSDAIERLEISMQRPLSAGLAPSRGTRAAEAGTRAATGAGGDPKQDLQTAAGQATAAIATRVHELGGDIAFALVTGVDWKTVEVGAKLLGKDITDKLEEAKKGLGALLERAVGIAQQLLLNVYDKILALLGKGVEDEARQQVQQLLEKIKKDGKIELFDTLIDGLYQLEPFKKQMAEWLSATKASPDTIAQTSGEIRELGSKFVTLAGYMGGLQSAIALAKKWVKIPELQVITTGLQVALLAVVVYVGYDYIGYKQVRFLDITKGVAEVIEERLGV